MSKVRQDAWSHENDLMLAETVLRHIREGGTQLLAFEEVGDRLNRTSAACGFRWNAIVRDKYKQAIEIAKKQRKERKRSGTLKPASPQQKTSVQETSTKQSAMHRNTEETKPAIDPINTTMTLNDVITFLKNLKKEGESSAHLQGKNERLLRENEEITKKNEQLEKELARIEKKHTTIQEDYQSLIQIMERARRMVVLQDADEQNLPSFRMDKNGNLEQVAK